MFMLKQTVRPLAFALILTLAACSGDVRDTKIADIDLTNMSEVQKVTNRLEPDERAAFGLYVMNRTVGSIVMPGKEIVRTDGKAPETVREAIALAKVRKAQQDKRGALMKERNALVERHNALMSNDGSGLSEANKAEWDRLEKQIADYDAKLKEAE
jgi:hypothetical protein